MIQLATVCLQTQTNVTQRFQSSQLTEKQLHKLIPAIQFTDVTVALVVLNALLKLVLIHKLKQLRENILTIIHTFVFYAKVLLFQIKKSKNAYIYLNTNYLQI
jgi:hypothetical protein